MTAYYHGDTVMRFVEEMELNFALGNVVKYVSRCGHKVPTGEQKEEKAIEDLEKAAWYVQREIDRRRQQLKERATSQKVLADRELK